MYSYFEDKNLYLQNPNKIHAAKLIRNFSSYTAQDQVEVCKILKSASLTFATIKHQISQKEHRTHSLIIIPFISDFLSSSSLDVGQTIINYLVEDIKKHGHFHDNPVPLSTFTSFSIKQSSHKQLYLYWCNQYSSLWQTHNAMLETVAAQLCVSQLATPENLQTIWDRATYGTKIHLCDLLLDHAQGILNSSPEFHALQNTINTWRNFHIGFPQRNNDNFSNGAHNVHLLDKYRSEYLAKLMKKTARVTPQELMDTYSRLQGKFVTPKTSKSIYEITTYSSLFGPLNFTMFEILQRIVCLIDQIVVNPKLSKGLSAEDEEEQERQQKVYVQSLELQTHAFQRLQEELVDMSGTCISGHINRLFNVTTGILSDLELGVNKSKIAYDHLEKVIKEGSPSILEDLWEQMVDQEYSTEVLDFLVNSIESSQTHIIKCYGGEPQENLYLVGMLFAASYKMFQTLKFVPHLINKKVYDSNIVSYLLKTHPECGHDLKQFSVATTSA